VTVVCPALAMLITPPQVHIDLLASFSAGMLPIRTVGVPAAQGAAITGMHGMGVSAPMAAAVADATVGLVRLVHIPKGGMFTIGFWSMMLAAGMTAKTLLTGSTFKVEGAAPNEHCSMAPVVTRNDMLSS
jgi:hypothetical protein